MIYPETFEQKIGFTEVRAMLREKCLSTLGKEQVEQVAMSDDAQTVNEWLLQVREFRRIEEGTEEFPLSNFLDVRQSVARIRLEGTHMEEQELFDLKRSLETIHQIIRFLNPTDGDMPYPALQRLTENVRIFPNLVNGINRILDKYGKVKDSASPELGNIRRELTDATILIVAQRVGTIIDADQIIVLEDGACVGKGTHRELLASCETYREIATLQLGEQAVVDEVRAAQGLPPQRRKQDPTNTQHDTSPLAAQGGEC